MVKKLPTLYPRCRTISGSVSCGKVDYAGKEMIENLVVYETIE